MIFPPPLLRRQITEDVILLPVGSAHAFSYHTRLWIRSDFSAALRATFRRKNEACEERNQRGTRVGAGVFSLRNGIQESNKTF